MGQDHMVRRVICFLQPRPYRLKLLVWDGSVFALCKTTGSRDFHLAGGSRPDPLTAGTVVGLGRGSGGQRLAAALAAIIFNKRSLPRCC